MSLEPHRSHAELPKFSVVTSGDQAYGTLPDKLADYKRYTTGAVLVTKTAVAHKRSQNSPATYTLNIGAQAFQIPAVPCVVVGTWRVYAMRVMPSTSRLRRIESQEHARVL